jgi:hypothetical protein
MDAGTLTFLGLHNIDRILLVRHAAGTDTVLGTQSATAGQGEFTFTAPGPVSAGELFAFVITTLLPLDLLPLEVGKAVSMSRAVQISAGGGYTCAVLPDGTVRLLGCQQLRPARHWHHDQRLDPPARQRPRRRRRDQRPHSAHVCPAGGRHGPLLG